MNKLIQLIKSPLKIFIFLNNRRVLVLSDENFLKIRYRATFHKNLDLDNPKTFNEKLQWLKLNDRNPKYTKMVDKYEVKKYISENIGSEYVIPTIGTYEHFDEINFDKLPNKFVIKCTHDSGGLVICKDKNKLNINKARKKINKALKRNFYICGREWPYKNVKPRIIIEKYLEDESGWELKDYKVLCFNGKARLIEIHSGRFENHTQDFYDINWKKTDITQGPTADKLYNKPKNFDLMIKFSEKLSKNIRHVRIDWYEVNGKLLFGEITFFDGSGFVKFDKDEYDLRLGKMIDLNMEEIAN